MKKKEIKIAHYYSRILESGKKNKKYLFSFFVTCLLSTILFLLFIISHYRNYFIFHTKATSLPHEGIISVLFIFSTIMTIILLMILAWLESEKKESRVLFGISVVSLIFITLNPWKTYTFPLLFLSVYLFSGTLIYIFNKNLKYVMEKIKNLFSSDPNDQIIINKLSLLWIVIAGIVGWILK